MFSTILRKCRRCGHRVPWQDTFRAQWNGRSTWVCGECNRELVEERSGYRQGQFQFMDEVKRREADWPF